MELKKLKVNDLVESIEYVSQIFSSDENITTFMQSPIHIMIYNEMSKYSKKELESVTSSQGEKEHLYHKVLHSRNPLLFAVFLEKDVFSNKLTTEAKWLLKNIDASPTLYETVFDAQQDRSQGKDLRNFMFYISKNIKILDETKQFELADKVYELYGKKKEKELINYIYLNISSNLNENFVDRVLELYNQNNVDINKYNFLNGVINESRDKKVYSNFFISSSDFPRINKLLEKGFKFEDKKFDHYGESLFVAVLKSKRVDIIKTVLPSLKMPAPRNMTMEKQHTIIDMYKSEKSYSEIKEIYYAKYYEYLADKLPEKDTKDIAKIKI